MRIHQIRTSDFSYTPLKGLDASCEVGCVPSQLDNVDGNNVKPVLNEFIKKPIFAEMKMPIKNRAEEKVEEKEVVDVGKILKNIKQNVAENDIDERKKILDKINDLSDDQKLEDKEKDVQVDKILASLKNTDNNNENKEVVDLVKILNKEYEKPRETSYEQKLKAIVDQYLLGENKEKDEPTVGDDLGDR